MLSSPSIEQAKKASAGVEAKETVSSSLNHAAPIPYPPINTRFPHTRLAICSFPFYTGPPCEVPMPFSHQEKGGWLTLMNQPVPRGLPS